MRHVYFPESIVSALNEAGLRGIVCGPQTQWPPREGGDDGSVRRELEVQLASNKPGEKYIMVLQLMQFTPVMRIHYLVEKNLLRSIMRTFQFTFQRPEKRLQTASRNLECIPLSISTALTSSFQKEQSVLMVHGLRNQK